ncbi:hypothetical protein JXA88_09060 [Candidatus Fermentibacteria bacterium]|nr:hypothetical protein [Candidatus Fermentibacteria bacterium]
MKRALGVSLVALSLFCGSKARGDDLPGGVTGTVYVQDDSTDMWVPLQDAVVVVAASAEDSLAVAGEGSVMVDDTGLHPRIQVVKPEGTLKVVSRSSSVHRLHGISDSGQRVFSLALTMPGLEILKRLTGPGLVRLTCDEGHLSQQSAYVLVTPHAGWAVTDSKGRYLIPGVPPSPRAVRAVHPEIGSMVDSVVVTPARAAECDFYLIRLDRPLTRPDSARE